MINYNIEVDRDIEYLYYNNNDLFFILLLSNMWFYDNNLNLKRESEFSANSKTSLIFNLDNLDKSIGKVGAMDSNKFICYKKSIDKINLAIQNNRALNEKILHTCNIPVLCYEDFHPLKLTRIIKFHWNRNKNELYHANIYIEDNKNMAKRFLVDGSLNMHCACSDDDIIKQVYTIFAENRFNDKKWSDKEIREIFLYPTIKQMY